MGIGGSLRELARFLDECEETGRVGSVDLAGGADAESGGTLTADVEVTLSTCPADGAGSEVSLAETSVDTDGRLRLAFESTDVVVPTSGHDVEVDVTDATVATDGTVGVTVAASVRTGGASVPHGEDAGRGVGESAGEAARSDRRSTPPASGAGESTDTDRDQEVSSERDPEAPSDRDPEVPSERDSNVPPFRDPDLLAEVYESCETFAEMTDALGMDVTAETVRRYMIDYGIHEPRSYDTTGVGDAGGGSSGEEEPETADLQGDHPRSIDGEGDHPRSIDGEGDHPRSVDGEGAEGRPGDATDDRQPADGDDDLGSAVVLADGIGLPDEVTVDAIVESVRTSNTVHEVSRDVGLDRDDTVDLLRDLDLLDLVVGRLTTAAEREISRETVVDHLRRRAEAQ